MTTIDTEIRDLERQAHVVDLQCRAAELSRQSHEIGIAWAKRDDLKAKLKALKAERDKPPEQKRAEVDMRRREDEAHMQRRYEFETGNRASRHLYGWG